MADRSSPLGHWWPRHGIMATEAGRRVLLAVFSLTAVGFVLMALVMGGLLIAASAAGTLSAGTVIAVLVGMAAGLAAISLSFLVLPVLGRLSRLGDDMRMLELCDPGAPLLRELMDRAPGTYNHSIMTGALVEAGARSIGARPLLARVGAYYHDIGKLVRPQFFVENQLGIRNPHDDAPPEQSAFIITAHVREGVEMARTARLPEPVIDIIDQSHGTSLVTYFYRKASSGGSAPDETGFRYGGTRPQSKEAGLVMMADAAEAAARSLHESGPAGIEETVRRVAAVKIADGQLEQSGLSPEEIEAVIRVYAKMLSGLRHGRVEYPDPAREDGER